MASRRSSSAKDLIDIVASFPWWVGVALAVASFFLFASLAAQPLSAGSSLNILAIASGALRYAAPLLFLVAAVLSAVGRARRRQLLASTSSGRSIEAIARMDWREFEMLLSEAYRLQGYSVTELGGSGPDGGVDLVLRRAGKKTLVQCKHWKARSIGVQVVRELLGVMTDRGAESGHIVTSGRFTDEAINFASSHSITLVDGRKLDSMLAGLARGVTPGSSPERLIEQADLAEPGVPLCPRCSASMVKRLARKGPRAGEPFWGCSAYPKCKATRPMDAAA